ncbi:hypothetical protein T492DRAFT_856459, partial [Pavlovales sp. CCMP2436]
PPLSPPSSAIAPSSLTRRRLRSTSTEGQPRFTWQLLLTLVLMDEEIVEEGRLNAALSFILGVPPSWCAVIATADGPSRVRALVAVPAAPRESALDLAVKFRTFFTKRPGAFEELLGDRLQAAEINLEDGDPLPLVTIIPPTDRHDQDVGGGAGEETAQQLLPDSQPGDTQLVVQPIDTQYSIDNDGSLISAAYLVGLITVVCIVKAMERLYYFRAVHPAAPLMGEAEKKATLQLLLPGGKRSHVGGGVAPNPRDFTVSV